MNLVRLYAFEMLVVQSEIELLFFFWKNIKFYLDGNTVPMCNKKNMCKRKKKYV